MYGAAGWTHTPGVPGVKPVPKTKGIVNKGPRGETKGPKFNKADQANMRRTGVR